LILVHPLVVGEAVMKVVIFAGGLGTRLSEETSIRPKPMVEVGGRPILWHVMKIFAQYGLTDFVVLGGYKVEFIRNYFLSYNKISSDFTIDLATDKIIWSRGSGEPWRVTVLDTGLETMTGGRLKRAREVIGEETFCLTYGDGVSDVNIKELLAFHHRSGRWATVTAVPAPGRFGVLGLSEDGEKVNTFREKDSRDVGLINGGFFVCEPRVFELVDDDATIWERGPMERLVEHGQLAAYRHWGFWQSMDTLRDKAVLEAAWSAGAPWLKGNYRVI
jgi:glucose-1-phosphate cytidylyltransferase